MKKFVSLAFAFCFIFLFGITANASEAPLRLFSVVPDKDSSASEVCSYAEEKGFGGVVLDLRESNFEKFYNEIKASSADDFKIFVLAGEKLSAKLPAEANIIAQSGFSEESLFELSKKKGSEKISFFLPFGDESSIEIAEYFYGKGYFKTVFVENLFSCYSEYGYEEYLLSVSEKFPGAKIITLNDLGRILIPVAKGDFYGDAFELCNQYLVNKINGAGFCVSDFSALAENRFGSADFLTEYFSSTVLDEYADFSVSQKLEITRPTVSNFKTETDKYTVFGTSDPEKPLYMNGKEIERISTTGLFAVSVDVTKNSKTYTFTQGEKSDSVTISKGSGTSGTTDKLTSCSPGAAEIISAGNTEVSLSCIGPSGATITAEIGGKTVTLKQAAAADSGVPAWFNGQIDLSGDYPENETSFAGKVTYTLKYGGNTKTFESAGGYYYLGENAKLAIRANTELSGVEKQNVESGNYLTTLRTGCVDYADEITEDGWYKVSCGGYMKPAHCDIITGSTDLTNRISSAEREVGENYEKLILSCSNLPAFKGKISGKTFSITLYNTELSDFSSTDTSSELMYRINPVDNGDGSITVNFFSKTVLWGWDVFTDPENKTFSIVLKGTPTLSEDPAKPLSGITISVCSGHGGPDPGALSVAGEEGVNEAQINLANSLAIAECLEKLGAKIVLIIAEDKKLDTYERTDPARYAYSDVYICCHANSVAENSAANLWCGTYVYYHFDHSADFSKRLCDYISAATNRDNEGAKEGYYSVTRLTMCPAVMLEVGFVSNPKELESLIDQRDIQKTAFAVAKAVLEILDN